jgi:CRISPR-associated protein Cmr2
MDIERWKADVLMPLRAYGGGEMDQKLHDLLQRDDTSVALLVADVDRVQDYVFESVKLPEIRGGSELLENLNIEEIPRLFEARGLPGECILAKGGGSLLALVPVAHADKLAQSIERLYPERTDAATITCDWRSITPQMIVKGYPADAGAPFSSLVRWAGVWLRRRKEDKAPGPFFEAPPHAVRCRSCKQRSASTIYRYPDGEEWPICQVCHNKIAWSGRREARRHWIKLFDENLSDEQRQAYYGKERRPVELAEDLATIGNACCTRQGYVGFVYLDADGAGEYMLHRETPKAYCDAAEHLTKAALRATVHALASNLKPVKIEGEDEDKWRHPFEIITVGGDDVILIVPADVALPIAVQISEEFHAQMAQLAEQRGQPEACSLTMSGGVVIADDHNPVRVLLQISKELLRNAKGARQYLPEGTVQGMIDFHILLSQDMLAEKVKKVRRQFPYTLSEIDEHGQKRHLRLLGRPYTTRQMAALWEGLQDLAGTRFPRSQMHRLGENLLTGRRPSTLFYAYQKARGETRLAYQALDELIRAVRQLDDTADPEPWFKLPGNPCFTFATALWDIVELYDFVPR